MSERHPRERAHRRSKLAALLALAALPLSCGSALPAPPQAAPLEAIAAPSAAPIPPAPLASAAPAAPPIDTSLPRAIKLPDKVACALDAKPWRPSASSTRLRFHPFGLGFADVRTGTGRLHIAVGPAENSAVLEIEANGVAVKGWVDAKAVDLRPTRAFVMSQFVAPQSGAKLRWIDARPGELSVTQDIGPGVEVLAPPLRAARPCEDLALQPANFDALAAVVGSSAKRASTLPIHRSVPLSVEPGYPPVAELSAQWDAEASVSVFDTQGTRSRILWRRGDAWVFGWVDTAELHAPVLATMGQGAGFGLALDHLSGYRKRVSCDADVPLVAEVQRERATVGVIRHGTVIEVWKAADGYSSVAVSGPINAAVGASFLVRSSDLAACSPPGAGAKRR